MNGSGMFVGRNARQPHLLVSGASAEIAYLRSDVAGALLPLVALTIDEFLAPATASGTAFVTSTTSSTSQATFSGTGLNGVVGGSVMANGRNVTCTTSNHSATWTGNLHVTGLWNGVAQTDTLAMANNTTITGTKPFDQITKLVMDAQVDALGTFTIGTGLGLALGQQPKLRGGAAFAWEESVDGAKLSAPTGVISTHALYTPSTAPNAAHNYAVIYEAVSGTPGQALAITLSGLGKYTTSQSMSLRVPAATGAVLKTGVATGTSQPVALTTQPDYSRSLQLETDGSWVSSADVVVTFTGIDQNGNAATQIITIPASTAVSTVVTATNSVAFSKVTAVNYTVPGGWSAGTFAVQAGGTFGLLAPPGGVASVYKEVVATDAAGPPVYTNNGTLGTTNTAVNTYTPYTAIDGLTDYNLYYQLTGCLSYVQI